MSTPWLSGCLQCRAGALRRSSRVWSLAACGDTGLRRRPRSGNRRRDDRQGHGRQCCRAFVDRSATVRRASGGQPDVLSGVARFAFGPAIDRQLSAGLGRARAAIAGPVHQHVSWKSAAMSSVGLDRRLAARSARLSIRGWKPRNPTNGRQGKSPAFGRAYMVGKIEEFTNVINTRCWHFLQIVQAFQGFERQRPVSPGSTAP